MNRPISALMATLACAGALARLTPAIAQEQPAPSSAAAATQRITAACAIDITACRAVFDRYSRKDLETNVSGSLSFLSLFKASGQTFFGYAEELYYTEVRLNGIEYQVGFGYIVTAHQQDAKPQASGLIGATQVSGDVELGATSFTTSIIGLAPDVATDCTAAPLTTDQALMCAVKVHPTVTQDYYKTAVQDLSSGLSGWLSSPPTVPGRQPICPQVIAYRVADRSKGNARPVLTDAQSQDFLAVQTALQSACPYKAPNVHLHFRNGKPRGSAADMIGGGSISVAGATVDASRTTISQGYYRNRYYWAATGADPRFYDKDDRYTEVSVEGLSAAGSLPSIFAAVISLTASADTEHIHVYSHCTGGATPSSLPALASKPTDPVAQVNAYSTLFENLRNSTDNGPAICPAES